MHKEYNLIIIKTDNSNYNDNIKIEIKEKEEKEDILIRIAWFDRDYNKYDFGAWRSLSDEDKNQDKVSISNWIKQQNKKYPRVKYWIEAIKNGDKEIKNIEYYDLIGIENEKMGNMDWLAL